MNLFGRRTPKAETPSEILPAASLGEFRWKPSDHAESIVTDDSTIDRLEPLLVHCPRNIKILTSLAAAYSHKLMFDKALALYERALAAAKGSNAEIEAAITEMLNKKTDIQSHAQAAH